MTGIYVHGNMLRIIYSSNKKKTYETQDGTYRKYEDKIELIVTNHLWRIALMGSSN